MSELTAPTTLIIEIREGTPKPKGSLRFLGKGRVVEQVEGSKEWRSSVAKAAGDAAIRDGWQFTREPVQVIAGIYLEQAASNRDERPRGHNTGDLDKHARNILDALVDAKIIADDSQVTSLVASKDWRADDDMRACVIVSRYRQNGEAS